jgi:hypothetical protein
MPWWAVAPALFIFAAFLWWGDRKNVIEPETDADKEETLEADSFG